MILVVSAHFDDAVFSCGDWMAAQDDDIVVCTVFGGSPRRRGFLSDWDRECGFESSHEAMARRRDENNCALAELGATPVDLWFAEVAYNAHRRSLETEITDALLGICHELLPDVLMAPFGLTHPDHTVVADAASVVQAPRRGIYADIPYIHQTVSIAGPEGSIEERPKRTSFKVDLIQWYASQLSLVERMGPVLSQERIWWVG